LNAQTASACGPLEAAAAALGGATFGGAGAAFGAAFATGVENFGDTGGTAFGAAFATGIVGAAAFVTGDLAKGGVTFGTADTGAGAALGVCSKLIN